METFHDSFGNTATIKEVMTFPYKGATEKEKGFVLTLTCDYENDFVYFVSVYETRTKAIEKLFAFSCGRWKEAA